MIDKKTRHHTTMPVMAAQLIAGTGIFQMEHRKLNFAKCIDQLYLSTSITLIGSGWPCSAYE